jgi:hypothetical protein
MTMTAETEQWYLQTPDPPLPSGTLRSYLGDTGAAVIVVLYLLFVAALILYVASTALGI